jgi:hypothetical protein
VNEEEEISPTEGWVESLSRVLLWPAAVMLSLGLIFVIVELDSLAFVILGAAIGMVIHFICYLVIGLPFYLCFWRTSPDLWTWKIGIPTGTILGAFALMAISSFGSGITYSRSDFLAAFLLGGGYGVITAAAAITSRKKKAK